MQAHDVVKTHQSRALLIKLRWLTISGVCLILISIFWWDETVKPAYIFAKVGVDSWLVSGLGLMVAANIWLRPAGEQKALATKIKLALWSLLSVCLGLAMIGWARSHQGSRSPIVDIVALLIVILGLAAANKILPALGALRITVVVGVLWLLAGSCLLVAGVLWVVQATAWIPFASVVLPSTVAFLLGTMCLRITRRNPKLEIALQNVARKIDLVAGVLSFCSGLTIIATLLAYSSKPNRASLVTAALGLVSGLVCTKVRMDPRFADRLTVFSTSTGTQFIFPIEILLDDASFVGLQKLSVLPMNVESQKGKAGKG